HSYQLNGPVPSPGAITICGYLLLSTNLAAAILPPITPTSMGRNFPASYLNQKFPARISTRPSESMSAAAAPSAYLNPPLASPRSPASPEKIVSYFQPSASRGFFGISAIKSDLAP